MLLPPASALTSGKAGALPLWPAALAAWGPGSQSQLHAHHAWHLMVALTGHLQLRRSPKGRSDATRVLLTSPDVPHAIDARGCDTVIVFVEPESELGSELARLHLDPVHVPSPEVAERVCQTVRSGGEVPVPEILVQALREMGIGHRPPPLRHPAIRKVLRALRADGAETDESLEALSAIARLSPSRFMHAFTQDVGIPLRPYLRWLKFERAAALIAGGASLSEAAHGAGFSDSAHMTRTFRSIFGVTPSELRRSQSVQARQG